MTSIHLYRVVQFASDGYEAKIIFMLPIFLVWCFFFFLPIHSTVNKISKTLLQSIESFYSSISEKWKVENLLLKVFFLIVTCVRSKVNLKLLESFFFSSHSSKWYFVFLLWRHEVVIIIIFFFFNLAFSFCSINERKNSS